MSFNLLFLSKKVQRQNQAANVQWGMFPISERAKKLHWDLLVFMDQHIYPAYVAHICPR